MLNVLLTDDVDRRIAARASSQVIEQTRRFVHDAAPAFAAGADALIDQAEPVVTELVGKAVNSQPGEGAMLAVSRQAHGVFLAWLNHDSLGPPGLQADLATGQARLDLDELLVGQHIGIGPLQVPMDGLDLPGLGVPVPLPPDWLPGDDGPAGRPAADRLRLGRRRHVRGHRHRPGAQPSPSGRCAAARVG